MALISFLDACVLFPANLRDVILTIAERGIFQIRWSAEVLDEMERNLVKRARRSGVTGAEDSIHHLRVTMEQAFPDAMVGSRRYRSLVRSMPVNEKDRHVLAAAVASHADILVTDNLRDFPRGPLSPYGIEPLSANDFLQTQFDHAPQAFLECLDYLTLCRKRPPLTSVEGILLALSRSAPGFSRRALENWRSMR